MTQSFIWINEDTLGINHPVFEAASRDAIAIFIWDQAYFQRQNYSLKRLAFIYECLIDLQQQIDTTQNGSLRLEVYEGDTQSVLQDIIYSNDGACDDSAMNKLYVPGIPNPYVLDVIRLLGQDIKIAIIEPIPFMTVPDDVDMRRFFRFWKRARKSALGLPSDSIQPRLDI